MYYIFILYTVVNVCCILVLSIDVFVHCILLLLFPWLFLSYRVACITDDLPTPCHPVRLPARSQSSTFHALLALAFPSCFRLSSLPFIRYIRPQHFPQFFVSPHHMPVPDQSPLLEACATLVVPRMCSFLILYLRVTPHDHRSIHVDSILLYKYHISVSIPLTPSEQPQMASKKA